MVEAGNEMLKIEYFTTTGTSGSKRDIYSITRNGKLIARLVKPHGGKPYIVVLEGSLSEDDIKALVDYAKKENLPIFACNRFVYSRLKNKIPNLRLF